MPRAVKHAAPRAAEHAALRDRSAEHAAARTLDALPTFVGKPFVPLEAELKNPKPLRRAAADGGDDDESAAALPRPPTVQTGRLATRRRSL